MVSIVLATLLDEQQTPHLRSFLERDVPGNLFALSMLKQWGVQGQKDAEGRFDSSDRIVGPALLDRRTARFDCDPCRGPEATRLIGVALATRGGAGWVLGDRLASMRCGWGWVEQYRVCALIRYCFKPLRSPPARPLKSVKPMLRILNGCMRPRLKWSKKIYRSRGLANARSCSHPIFVRPYGKGLSMLDLCRIGWCTESSAVLRVRTQIGIGGWGPGLGQAGTRSVCELLLQRTPRVTMHVRADNARAIRCYESIGFEPIRDFRLLVR